MFQLYFTTFLIETGYEKPNKIKDKMLKSHMQDGSFDQYKEFYIDSLELVQSAVLK